MDLKGILCKPCKILAFGHVVVNGPHVAAVTGDDEDPRLFVDGEITPVSIDEMYDFLRFTHVMRAVMDSSCDLVISGVTVKCGRTPIKCGTRQEAESLFSMLDRALVFCGYDHI